MKKSIRAAAAAMLIPILLTLTGCSLTVDGVMSVIAPTETPVPGSDLVFSDAPEVTPEPRQIAYEKMDGVFSPFFAETDGDKAVAEMTQLSLRAVEGNRAPAEITRTTGTDGTVSVTIRLEKGLLCADGVELTADDLLFTYYVLMDESYDGPYTINQLPIDGIALYWNGMDSGMYGKYMMIYDEIYNGGKYESDLEKAVDWLRQKGMAKAAKKSGRATSEGLVMAAVSADGKTVAMSALLCETDFVARGEQFEALAAKVAQSVLDSNPADAEALKGLVGEDVTQLIASVGENMQLGNFTRHSREDNEVIGQYIHANRKIGVLVDLVCDSAATAAKPEVQELAKNVAMQVAATNPMALDGASLDAAAMEREREVYRQKAREEGKPEQIVEKIAEGAVKKFQKEVCLMEQPYIRDDKKNMTEVVREVAKAVGGDIKVAGFSRIQLAAE